MATSPKRRIHHLISTIDDDRELLRAIEEYEREVSAWRIARSAGSWAHTLYQRDREHFLPLIERHLSVWGLQGTSGLEPWLQEAAEHRDHSLFRILYRTWLQDTVGWGGTQERWSEDLRRAFREAGDHGTRRDVLERYDLPFEVSDEDATELYGVDPRATESWIRARIERADWLTTSYEKLAEAARDEGNDDLFYWLYSRTFPVARWLEDVRRLAVEVTDADELNRELERRHARGPEAWVSPVGLVELAEKRGEDVRAYLASYVGRCSSWGFDPAWNRLMELSADRGWWEVWTATVRSHFDIDNFNALVTDLVADRDRPEWETAALLSKIAGTQYGFGKWRQTIALQPEVGLNLYRRFAELARGLFIDHFRPDHNDAYAEVAEEARRQGDHRMVDLLAARAVTVTGRYWTEDRVENVGWYVEHYQSLDAETFAQRAVEVVAHVEAFEFLARNRIRHTNPLYPVFFADAGRYRPVLGRVRTLLECSCEDVRYLGLRMLALDGEEQAELAHANVDHLLAYLLNRATRRARIAAFEALALAASTDEETARRIADRARETLDLRCRDYPRNRLIELIGRVIHRWPALRTEREVPVVYSREAS